MIFVRRLKTYNIFPVCLTTWVIIGSFTLLSTAATFEEIERERLQEAFWSFRAEFGADLEDFAYQLQGRRVARLSQATSILTSLDFCKESPFDKKGNQFFGIEKHFLRGPVKFLVTEDDLQISFKSY